jgi:signal transduction histidine kinase
MDAASIAKALEPYGQVGEPVGSGERGTGLGLSIVLRLTELHGGRLSIASAPGQGTTVRATFPAERRDGGRK